MTMLRTMCGGRFAVKIAAVERVLKTPRPTHRLKP